MNAFGQLHHTTENWQKEEVNHSLSLKILKKKKKHKKNGKWWMTLPISDWLFFWEDECTVFVVDLKSVFVVRRYAFDYGRFCLWMVILVKWTLENTWLTDKHEERMNRDIRFSYSSGSSLFWSFMFSLGWNTLLFFIFVMVNMPHQTDSRKRQKIRGKAER